MDLVERLRRHRAPILASVDGLAWVVALFLAAAMRFDNLSWSPVLLLRESGAATPIWGASALAAAAVILHLGMGRIVRLHYGRARTGSFEEIILLGGVTGTVGVILTTVNALGPTMVPRSVPIAATFGCLAMTGWARAGYRWTSERRRQRAPSDDSRSVLVVGAGEGGRQLVESMVHDRRSTWNPVGFLDDDPRKRHLRILGIPVLGPIADLADAAERTGCESVVVAVPSAGPRFMLHLSREAHAVGLDVKVLPGVTELIDRVGITDVRDIQITDVLGRHQIETDVETIAGYLQGKRVLVTGAGGSIGSELCRQIQRFAPAQLFMLDRDESALHKLRLGIAGVADLDGHDTLLADIRDPGQVNALFRAHRPEVVFHAAALKHVNMLERFPEEAVKTNVISTTTVLEAAAAVGVDHFVNISTDKAADPCSILGYTKRIAEGLTAEAAKHTDGTFLSVRFGNVLGSRGSVLTTFAAQIAAGGPLTVTHPDVSRYFMTIEEAVELVIQAAAIGRDGEALVLDMGNQVRILDVAHQLIEQSDRPIEVVYTGLKPGEKLTEQRLGKGEIDVRPRHRLVSHVPVPAVGLEVYRMHATRDRRDTADALRGVCDGMARSASGAAQRDITALRRS